MALGDEGACRAPADLAMERYAAGDDDAFGDLYDVLAPRLGAYFRRQLRSASLADDFVQQTLLHMHRARGSFIPGAEVLPWAFAIARRLLIDNLRRTSHEVRLDESEARSKAEAVPSTEASADQLMQMRELASRLERALTALPENQRVAYELVKHDGLTLAQAAEVLGISVGAVKLRTHRAYEALRAAAQDPELESATEAEGFLT